MNLNDQKFMSQALKLAQKVGRAVAPNPMVGAVIVKGGKVIGKGYHQKFGGPHAEVLAVNSVKNKSNLQGATLYVTLEPCRHHGKTPPCWELIQEVGIKRVISGSSDPLHGALFEGEVTSPRLQIKHDFLNGRMAENCKTLNKFFFTWVEKKRPYITVKIAMSADGFVAGKGGAPVHFTSKKQDKFVHQLRAEHQAILVGSNTVLKDDSHLGVRHAKGQDPLRIILDSKKRLSKHFRVFRDQNVWHVTKKISLRNLFEELGKKGIASVLVEPGPTLYYVLKKEGLIDELIVLKGAMKLKDGIAIELQANCWVKIWAP